MTELVLIITCICAEVAGLLWMANHAITARNQAWKQLANTRAQLEEARNELARVRQLRAWNGGAGKGSKEP